jgi:hypothetical protein
MMATVFSPIKNKLSHVANHFLLHIFEEKNKDDFWSNLLRGKSPCWPGREN